MGAGSSSSRRRRGAPAAAANYAPETEQLRRNVQLPPLAGPQEPAPASGGPSPLALALARQQQQQPPRPTSWDDGSSPASFSSSAKSAGPLQPSKAVGHFSRRREPPPASSETPAGAAAGRRAGRGVGDVEGGVAAAVTIQSAFRAHRVRQQVHDFRQVAEGHSAKIATRRSRRGERGSSERHHARRRASPLKPLSPASAASGKRATLQPLAMDLDEDLALAVDIPEDAMRSARVREWVATGGDISPGGGIMMTNRSAVADTFLSGSRAKPAKLSTTTPLPPDLVPPRGEPAARGRAGSTEQVGGSQGGNNRSNQEAGGDRPSPASSYDAGAAESPSRASPSRPGPPSVTTQSTWEDGASSHVPSPSEVRQRARARKGPRRRRHPPRQRGSASVASRSDTSASRSQPPWQGPPGGWPAGPPPGPWGYGPPPGYGYAPPATAPAGVAARHVPGGWEGAFHQGPPVAGYPGGMWPQQHPQQPHYGQPPWWGGPTGPPQWQQQQQPPLPPQQQPLPLQQQQQQQQQQQ
eukprot:COSAG06_NODE_10584_length_1653_cov_56.353282_1_plen_524_part_10